MVVRTPPKHLSARSRKLWVEVVGKYQHEVVDLERLRLACEALDRCEDARALIADQGAIICDRFDQIKPHPAVAIERDARIAALRALRELGIEGEHA